MRLSVSDRKFRIVEEPSGEIGSSVQSDLFL